METLEEKKMRGGYYTPPELACFITSWCIKDESDKVLEPSAGEGRFIDSVLSIKKIDDSSKMESNILAVEFNSKESQKIALPDVNKRTDDFFSVFENELHLKEKFDVLLGNPPFIRYQNFDKKYRDKAFSLMGDFGFSPNKMTNIWIPFLLLSIQLLTDDGRIGMVVPAELMQVDYAKEARKYLLSFFDELIILTFEKNIFDGAQQEVIVLLGQKKSKNKGVKLVELKDLDSLKDLDLKKSEYEIKPKIVSSEKWLKYFLSEAEIENFEKAINNTELTSINDLIEVNVGVVTGQNKFFVIDKETVEKFDLHSSTIDIVGRAEQVRKMRFKDSDLAELYNTNKKVKMFNPSQVLSEAEKEYIKYGENNGYDLGYKTRIRKEWYRVPLSWKPEAFFLRQVHEYPRVIINETESVNTDTLHKLRAKSDCDIENLAIYFLNSLTLLHCELVGRSYGGGVLTFEPGEVRQLIVPKYEFTQSFIRKIENLIAEKKIAQAIELIDKKVLIEGYGYSTDEVSMFNYSWDKLKSRRLSRKK